MRVDEQIAAKQREIEEKARKDAEEAARKAGDVESLEKSWSEKLNKTALEKDQAIERLNGQLHNLLVDNVASSIANEIALQGSANVLLPHIRARLTVAEVDGKPTTRVLGADGKPSALSVDELKQEFATNEAFAPIIAGSKASGGGAGGANGGRAAPSGNRSKMSTVEKAEYIEKHGAEAYSQLPD